MSSRTHSPKTDETGILRSERIGLDARRITTPECTSAQRTSPKPAVPFTACTQRSPSPHHRPWPLPGGPWIMQQIWNDLLFAHWPIAPEIMRPLVPPALPLDTFNGQCWLAVTPFHMTGVRGRLMPAFPGLSAFPELNVRTYVTYGGTGGVYFFSLDAGSRVAAG